MNSIKEPRGLVEGRPGQATVVTDVVQNQPVGRRLGRLRPIPIWIDDGTLRSPVTLAVLGRGPVTSRPQMASR